MVARMDVTAESGRAMPGGQLVEPPEWALALERAQTVQTILFLGATDTGKTTFLTWLANALHAQGRRVSIVDADVGQSSVGPPTTIGLGLVSHPMQCVQELVPVRLYFVGATSPRGHLLPMVVGTKRLVDRGRTLGVDHVLVDTCGYVRGPVARTLKQHKIALVAPDLILCLQRGDECEGILRAYRESRRPQIIRLRASRLCRERSMGERREYRAQALRRYFADATPRTLRWDRLNLIDPPLGYGVPLAPETYARLVPPGLPEVLWMERSDDEIRLVTRKRLASRDVVELMRAEGMPVRTRLAAELQGTLLALLDETGDTLGLGMLRHIHFARHHLVILAPRIQERIAGIQWSRTRLGRHGEPLEEIVSIPQAVEVPPGE
jgi:polynucleotide 5'-hydroxyl-kinase GRC3/NOL9